MRIKFEKVFPRSLIFAISKLIRSHPISSFENLLPPNTFLKNQKKCYVENKFSQYVGSTNHETEFYCEILNRSGEDKLSNWNTVF